MRRVRHVGHARIRFGAEILDDDFLNVAVALMQIANCLQSINTFRARFADADEDAGGKRDFQFAREPQHFETRRRMFVGRTKMWPAFFAQALGRAFQHQALRRTHLAQPRHIIARHHAGVHMRQQCCFTQHQRTHRVQVVDGGGVTQHCKFFACRPIAQLGFVAKREQRLGAARRLSRFRDIQHFIRGEVNTHTRLRRVRKRAVAAHVAAQLRQRNKYFARIRDERAVARIAQARGLRHQVGGSAC